MLGHSREDVVREGGLEGSGSEEVRRTSSSAGPLGRPHGRDWCSEGQFVNDPTPPSGGHRLMGQGQGRRGAGLAHRWVLFVRQS